MPRVVNRTAAVLEMRLHHVAFCRPGSHHNAHRMYLLDTCRFRDHCEFRSVESDRHLPFPRRNPNAPDGNPGTMSSRRGLCD
jgi:hypothetical protein